MNTPQKLDMVKKAQMQAKILLSCVTFGVFFFAFLLSSINPVFGQVPGYSYRVKITIDGSQVCGISSLTNFPILVQHTAPFLRPTPDGLVINANGYDVVFTASNGTTLLNHQLDHYSYDASNGTYSAWVNIPSLPPGSNTDIYMYYGNASITTDQSSTGTWDSNFRTVYHFQSNNLNDGTVNTINGTNNGTSDAGAAHIGGGRDFDGTNDYIETTSNDLITANNFTLSAWFKTDITNPSHIMWQGLTNENGWGDGGAGPQGQELNLSIGTCCTATPNYVSAFLGHTEEQLDANGLTAEIAFTNTTNWHYVVATMSDLSTSPVAQLYIDGTLVDTDAGAPAAVDRSSWNNTLRVGRPSANDRFFNGQLDEIRVSNIPRSADWICTEYNNQNNPGSGLTFTNDPPDLASIEGTSLNYTEGDPVTIITSSLSIADENDAYLSSATVQISANYVGSEDVLAFTNAFGITGSWDSGSGILTLTGLATLANYQNALRSVSYQNTNLDNPSTLTRTASFIVNDGTANSNIVTRNILVVGVNDAPVAVNNTYTVNEDTPLNVAVAGILTNDSDVDGNPITTVLVSTTSNGTLTLNANGSFAYTPNANYNGNDSFTYSANDGTLNSGVATVTITITPVNDAPTAVIDTYSVNEDTPLNIAAAGILTNDSDVEGSPITAVLVSTTSNGSLTLNANGSFVYTPNSNYTGSDSFTYRANDGTLNSGIATVTITITPVNDSPTAVNDTYTVDEDTPLNIAASGVLANDFDVEGNPITAVLVSTTSNGSLTLNANGSFVYTPNSNYNGSDSFTYRANDGTLNSGVATVTITITPVNDAPTVVNDTYTVNEDTPLNIAAPGVLNNDSDVEGNPFTAVLVSTTSNGSLTLNANGSFAYTPNANYNGSDSFTYRANDGTLNSGVTTVTITITPVNDAPEAVSDNYTVNEDTPLNVAAAGILTNDSDVDGNLITAVLVTTTSNGSLTLNANGSFAYTPNANYNGNDSFTYRANDGTLNSGVATVTITITPVNDAPTAVNDTYTVNEDTPLNIAVAGILTNDSDVDGNPITAVLVSTTSNGSLTLNANGSFTYTPNTNYNGNDSFTYHANDGTLNSGLAIVNITVTPTNDAPVAVNDTYTVNEDTPLSIAASGVLTNDSDVDANPLTAVLVSTTSNGSLTLSTNGSFAYTPNTNYNGSDSFSYRSSDGTLTSDIATVTITITPVNNAPVSVNDTYTVNEDTPLNIAAAGVLTNDSDVDANPITAVLVSTTSDGGLTLGANGSFTYTPNTNFSGSDSFTYRSNDGTLNSGIATVTITITAVNDAPVAVNDTYTVNEDTPLNIAAAGILSNDSDVDANPLTAVLVSTTSNGTLTLNANGSFTYAPNANYNGSDSFIYNVNDGTLNSGVTTVTITITPVNDAPIAVNDTYAVNEDATLSVGAPGILNNDSDQDGNPVTAILIGTTTNGTLTLNPNGSFTYLPTNNFNGSDSFTYQAYDGTANSTHTTVTLSVAPVNDTPIAANDAVVTTEDTPVSIDMLNNVADNDNTLNGSSITILSSPLNGVTSINTTTGFVTYTPNADFSGNDSFTYVVNDTDGGTSNSATVAITVTPVNDAPVAVDDNAATLENSSVLINLLPNDSDKDDGIDPSTVTIIGNASSGSLIINPSTGVATYTPANGFLGNDSFTYTINDADGSISNVATVIIVISPLNDPPVAVDDGPITHASGFPLTIDVLANDNDPDNTAGELTIVSVTPPTFGDVSIENGVVVYEPSGTTSGTVTFTYTIQDPEGLTSSATVTIQYEYISLKISEGFSPNGDGRNDTWYIRSIESHPNNAIKVFDRWGLLVYEIKQYDNASVVWDGRANTGMQSGNYLDQGTYYYIVDLGDSTKELSGYVMIVR